MAYMSWYPGVRVANTESNPVIAKLSGSSVTEFTFHNSVTVASGGAEFAVGGHKTLTVHISGTSTSRTVEFKGRPPGAPAGTYVPLMGIRLSDLTPATSTTGNNEVWQFDITGLEGVIMDLSAVSGGNVTVKGKAVA